MNLLRGASSDLAAWVDFGLRSAEYYGLLAEISGRAPDTAAAVDGRGHPPSHVPVLGGGDDGLGPRGQEFKHEGHSLFGGADFADHGGGTASANLEPSVVQGLDRSGLHRPGVAGGAAEEQGEVAGEWIQPP